MWFIISTAWIVSLFIGAIFGAKWVIRVVLASWVLWFIAFLIAAGIQSEPATTVLGWGMVVILPVGILAMVMGVIAAGFANSWRRPSP